MENFKVRVIETEDGDRIGIVYNEETGAFVQALKLDSTHEMNLVKELNENLDTLLLNFDDCLGCKDCPGCGGFDDLDEDDEDDEDAGFGREPDNDLRKVFGEFIDYGVKQAQDIGTFVKETSANMASKVNKDDIEHVLSELRESTEEIIEKNKVILSKYAPTKEDLKKVLDKVSSNVSQLAQHTNETTRQKKINAELFKALEEENDNTTVCLKVFNGVGEDALKGLTTVYCKVTGKFTNPYGVFDGEDDQVTWEANHLKQVGEVFATIDYTKLKK